MSDHTLHASAGPGLVLLVLDAATARDMADAWELAHASGALGTPRPEFLLDVAAIKRAAINSDIQAGDLPAPVTLVDGTPRHLSLVGDR